MPRVSVKSSIPAGSRRIKKFFSGSEQTVLEVSDAQLKELQADGQLSVVVLGDPAVTNGSRIASVDEIAERMQEEIDAQAAQLSAMSATLDKAQLDRDRHAAKADDLQSQLSAAKVDHSATAAERDALKARVADLEQLLASAKSQGGKGK